MVILRRVRALKPPEPLERVEQRWEVDLDRDRAKGRARVYLGARFVAYGLRHGERVACRIAASAPKLRENAT